MFNVYLVEACLKLPALKKMGHLLNNIIAAVLVTLTADTFSHNFQTLCKLFGSSCTFSCLLFMIFVNFGNRCRQYCFHATGRAALA